jgi:hypothetical protein
MRVLLWVIMAIEIGYLYSSCHSEGMIVRRHPIHKGVDVSLQPLMNEFKSLAAENGIHFKNEVSVGFTDIKVKRGQYTIIGVTHYGKGFREIDIDRKNWEYSSDLSRKALLWHEATHAYCYRGHTYGNGQDYPVLELDDIFDFIKHYLKTPSKPKPGYMSDYCPMSIMRPVVVSDFCMKKHYEEYKKEMFTQCVAY